MISNLSRCLTLVCGCLLLVLPSQSSGRIVERVLRVVNDEPITLMDADEYQQRLQDGSATDELLITPEARKKALASRDDLLALLQDEKLVDSEIKREGIEVPADRIEQETRNVMARNNLTREQLKSILARQNMDLAEFQESLRKQLKRQTLIQKAVTSQVKVSDDEVTAYYLSHSGAGQAHVFEYSLAHILFDPQRGGSESAKLRADKVYEKIQQGLSFEDAAIQFTEDPKYVAGGVLGTFRSGEFLPELEAAVKDLAVGSVSTPVKTKSGHHLVRLLKRSLVSNPQLEKERGAIMNRLMEEGFKRQFQYWMEQLRQSANIRKNAA